MGEFALEGFVSCRAWRSADVLGPREGLDDEHWSTTVSAYERGPHGAGSGTDVDWIGSKHRDWLMQQLASGRDVELAIGVGEQAIVADAMKAGGQYMQQEAAHKLLGGHGHGFVACPSVFSVVFPAERDATIVQCHEA